MLKCCSLNRRNEFAFALQMSIPSHLPRSQLFPPYLTNTIYSHPPPLPVERNHTALFRPGTRSRRLAHSIDTPVYFLYSRNSPLDRFNSVFQAQAQALLSILSIFSPFTFKRYRGLHHKSWTPRLARIAPLIQSWGRLPKSMVLACPGFFQAVLRISIRYTVLDEPCWFILMSMSTL